jgi:aarF domain-containing kinase
LYIKAGQYLASLNNLLPEEYITTLSVLQDAAPFQPFSMVERVIHEDFGAPVEKLFKEFDPVPIAAASLAQVHRAVTYKGEEVAVKVQYEQLQGVYSLSKRSIAT